MYILESHAERQSHVEHCEADARAGHRRAVRAARGQQRDRRLGDGGHLPAV